MAYPSGEVVARTPALGVRSWLWDGDMIEDPFPNLSPAHLAGPEGSLDQKHIMKDIYRLIALGALAALVVGCGPDEVDAASDAEAAASARQAQARPAPAPTPPAGATGEAAPPTGPPTSAPAQMKPGQGMASVKRRTTTRPDLTKDEELPP